MCFAIKFLGFFLHHKLFSCLDCLLVWTAYRCCIWPKTNLLHGIPLLFLLPSWNATSEILILSLVTVVTFPIPFTSLSCIGIPRTAHVRDRNHRNHPPPFFFKCSTYFQNLCSPFGHYKCFSSYSASKRLVYPYRCSSRKPVRLRDACQLQILFPDTLMYLTTHIVTLKKRFNYQFHFLSRENNCEIVLCTIITIVSV